MIVAYTLPAIISFCPEPGFGPAPPPPPPPPPPPTAILIPVAAVPLAGDLINYIFQFANFAAAQRDPIVGPHIFTVTGTPANEVLVWANTMINSVDELPGFWCMITKPFPIDTTFSTHLNIQIVNDQTLLAQGKGSIVLSKLPQIVELPPDPKAPAGTLVTFNTGTAIMFNIYGNYTQTLIQEYEVEIIN